MKKFTLALIITMCVGAFLQETFAGSGTIARQNARRGAGHANLAGDPDIGKALGGLGKSLGKAFASKEPSTPSDPMCDNSDCNASKVKKGTNGLPTTQTIGCAKAKCNKNFRKRFKTTFCEPYSSDPTVVKIYDSETMTSELALEIAERITKDGRSVDFLKDDNGEVVTDPNQRVRRVAQELRDYAEGGKVGGISCLRWFKDQTIYPFYDMEQIKAGDINALVKTLGICDDIAENRG
ncbi:MAG: hypothetical protein K2Q34_04045 [Alphaproteobacteria bacterium]|nr:hypothetical protein [Alphaproteobacteria bacterium]